MRTVSDSQNLIKRGLEKVETLLIGRGQSFGILEYFDWYNNANVAYNVKKRIKTL